MTNLQWAAAKVSYGVVNYRHPLRAKVLRAVKRSYEQTYTATTPMECAEIYQAVLACEKIPGDIAEAGVYLGGTAQLILSTSKKRIHLFDTFEGLPHGEDDFQAGEWTGSLEQVKRNLANHADRLEFHPGLFPDSTAGFDDLRFSFVHLDLDLYDSTLAALEWFWPRLESGGILMSHDYPLAAGVVKAFHEFFDTRSEPFIPLSGNQCLAVKS
jgi:O-methyltransferase